MSIDRDPALPAQIFEDAPGRLERALCIASLVVGTFTVLNSAPEIVEGVSALTATLNNHIGTERLDEGGQSDAFDGYFPG